MIPKKSLNCHSTQWNSGEYSNMPALCQTLLGIVPLNRNASAVTTVKEIRQTPIAVFLGSAKAEKNRVGTVAFRNDTFVLRTSPLETFS